MTSDLNIGVTVKTVLVEDMAVMTETGETFQNRLREGAVAVETDLQATEVVIADPITVNEVLLRGKVKSTQEKR